MDFKDKSSDWYEEFESKALSMITFYYGVKDHNMLLRIAKTFLKVRKEKIRLYGSDNVKKGKLLQLKALVKVGGAFKKPLPIKDIMSYEGVITDNKELLE